MTDRWNTVLGSDDVISIRQRTLDILKVGETFRASLQVEARELDFEIKDRIIEISAKILQDKLAEDHYTGTAVSEHPETTWQMFKRNHADTWWLRRLVRRWPVKYAKHYHSVTVQVERSFIYPEADVVIRELGRPVIFETLRPMRR